MPYIVMQEQIHLRVSVIAQIQAPGKATDDYDTILTFVQIWKC